jgi:two-component system, OmpR family, manganese sensing sensor histidine kinase
LLLSYLTTFAIVLAVLALAVHFVFGEMLNRDETARLETLGEIGQSVIDEQRCRVSVDLGDEQVRSLRANVEGLQWLDPHGLEIASHGLKSTASGIRTLDRTAVENLHVTTVRAVVSKGPYAKALRDADLGIIVGFLLAIAGSVIAGRVLTREAIKPIDDSFRRMSEFTSNAAHELRGPLTAVSISAEAAKPLDSGHLSLPRDQWESIRSGTDQMIRLVDDLLVLARSSQPLERDLFLVDVNACIEAAVETIREEARTKGVVLTIRTTELQPMLGNPDQVERIVANLVQNAVRFTASGGSVEVVSQSGRDGPTITVSDSGIGIAPEDVGHVFERFWRADPSRATRVGTGLGLTIARELARRHGGDVQVWSKVGVGSTFSVTFPMRPPSRALRT